MDLYKKANKTKLRFETSKGILSTEQLWDLPVATLNELAVSLDEQYKDSGGKSFIPNQTTTPKDKTIKLQLDVVIDILESKVKDQEKASKANETRLHNKRIAELIEKRKEGDMENLTVEELEKMIQ